MINLERVNAWIDVLLRVSGLCLIGYLIWDQWYYHEEVSPYQYLIGIAMVRGLPVDKLAEIFKKK